MFEWYERLAKLIFFPFPISDTLREKYEDALEFAHVSVKPHQAFGLAVLLPAIAFFFLTALSVYLGLLSFSVIMLFLVISVLLFYLLYTYPFYIRDVFRIKASEEMVLCVLYMATSLRISPNLERAVRYAEQNLSGALAKDLKNLLWNVYTRRYATFEEGFERFIEKWRTDYEEFAEALYLLKSSIGQHGEKKEEAINEAVEFILNGTKVRMKEFAAQLKVPITVINALGILLPIVGLIFLPFVAIFMPETFQPAFMMLGYNLMLPLTVYFMASYYLRRRPYSFHAVKVEAKPSVAGIIAAALLSSLAIYLIYLASQQEGIFSEAQFFLSLVATILIALAISSYLFLSNLKPAKQKKKIEKVEDEFIEAMYQLSNIVSRGTPLERSIEELTKKIKNLEISKLFQKILDNIRTFGVSFERAVFDAKIGAIKKYNSTLIAAILRAVAEISKKSFGILAKTLQDISQYLKNMKEVDNTLRELLEETTSSMRIQALLLAPLSAGVVTSLTALMIILLLEFGNVVETLFGASTGPLQIGAETFIETFVNINQIMPFYVFQMIVGIYLIEIVFMIGSFLATISKGDDRVEKNAEIAKNLIIAAMIYFVVSILMYFLFSSIVEVIAI